MEALSCPVFEQKAFCLHDFSQYEAVIFGGGLYAGGVSGIRFICRSLKRLPGKQILLFTCGLAAPDIPNNISNIRKSLEKAFSGKIPEQIRLFHLQGGIDYARLNVVHRSMMSMLRKMLRKKEEHSRSEEDRLILETYGQYLDFTNRESIRPLVEYAESVLSLR